nr:Gag-Pol polyprotein [Tanacetum cinerariifolium]
MIPEPGDTNREVPVNETFHVKTDDELTKKELKQIEADDQAIQTILLGLLEDIYAAEKKAKLFNEWKRFTSNDGESIESYYHRFLNLMNDLKWNKHFLEKIARNANHNLNGNGNLVAARAEGNAVGHNENQIRCYNCRGVGHFARNFTVRPRRRDIEADDQAIQTILLGLLEDIYAAVDSCETAQKFWLRVQQMMKGSDIGIQEKKAKMKSACYHCSSNKGLAYSRLHSIVIQNGVQNPRVQSGLIGVPGNANHNLNVNGNLVAARAEGNAVGYNENQIRCYNCRGVGYFARNFTVRPRRMDVAYLQTQLLIAQKEEAGIQLQAE